MADYIDREEALEILDCCIELDDDYCKTIAKECINDCDSVNVAPVRRGKWEEDEHAFWVCSNCRFPSEAHGAKRLYNYCPMCGAKMEED